MNIKPSIPKRAIKITTALALVAAMSVIAASLLMTGAGGATAFNTDASAVPVRNIPAQYTEQCSNGVAVPNPADNPGLVADCAALLASKDMLGGTRGNLNWSADIGIDFWDDVFMHTFPDHSVRVVALRMWGANLNGMIPVELGNLDKLGDLVLFDNRLTGVIPAELGNLDNLSQLNLRDNELAGAIPAELGNLDKLGRLDLRDNLLTGAIPVELGKLDNLMYLDLRDNLLTGTIPAELGNLANIRDLHLHGNQFTGCIPQSLRAALGAKEIERIGLPICGAVTATPTSTATSAPRPPAPATPVATPTPTATSVASNAVMNRLAALETQVAEIPVLRQQISAMATRIARLEGGSAIAPPTPSHTPTATPIIITGATPSPTPTSVAGVTPSPTATRVAGTSGGNACVTRLAGSARVTGSWSSACLSANSPPNDETYYSRFYTFTLDAAARVTITLSSATAAPYLYLLDGAGTDGAVRLSNGDVATSVAITANLQPGVYTIEASTWYSETYGDFTLELEIR